MEKTARRVAQSTAPRTIFSVSDLCEQFLDHSQNTLERSRNTLTTRKTHLKFFVEFALRNGIFDVRDIDNLIVDQFFAEYRKTRAKTTVNTCRMVLKVFIGWVYEYKEIPVRVKPDLIKLVRVRKKLPQAIGDDFTTQAIRGASEEQDALMIAVLREGGLRPGEMVNLRVEDILDDQLRITESKSEEDRLVNITGMLSLRLRKFAKSHDRHPHEWLFQNVYKGYGDKMTVKTAWRRVKNCYERTSGVHVYPRQLRHSCAIGLLKEGCDLVTIKEQLGHEDIQTTMAYLRIDNSFFKQSYAKSMKKSILQY